METRKMRIHIKPPMDGIQEYLDIPDDMAKRGVIRVRKLPPIASFNWTEDNNVVVRAEEITLFYIGKDNDGTMVFTK